MKTLLTIAQQNEFLVNNWKVENISHAWSCRGYGSSRIQNANGETLSKASGCGYDRFGTVIGGFIMVTFPDELQRLATRFCKTPYAGKSKSSKAFYGLFMDSKGKVYLDGACGYNCMYKILNAIGFELIQVGEHKTTYSGHVYYTMRPVSAHNKKYVLGRIK